MTPPELPIDPPSERTPFEHDDDCDCEWCDERQGEAIYFDDEDAREREGERQYESWKNGDWGERSDDR